VITPLYAGISGIMLAALSVRVILGRRRVGVPFGDGGDQILASRIRAHGNFIEYVPLALVLILLMELTSYPALLVHSLGATLLAGRLAHAWSMANANVRARVVGMSLTFLVLIVSAVSCILAAVRSVT
jgi:uncharacterized protein